MDRNNPAKGRHGSRSPRSAVSAERIGRPSQRPVRIAEAIGLLRRDPVPRAELGPHLGADRTLPADPIGADLEFRTWLVDEIFDPLVRQAIDDTSLLDELEEPTNW
jgi:hypothetical protein